MYLGGNMKQVKEYKIEEKNKTISNAVLRKISKNWTKEEWEEYLKENIDVELTETQIEPKEYKRICGDLTESIFKYSSDPSLSNRRLKDKLKPVLNLLSPIERKVIHLLFWKNMTYGEIAEKLHLSYGNVYTLKERAFRKLKKRAFHS